MAAGARPLGTWRNRILGSGEEAPDQLAANPRNWRTHPKAQRKALRGSLDMVGWVQQVIVNRRTGNVVDGHARIEEALSRNEPTIPVLYVDLSAEEEALVLATLDPIAAMAESDDERLRALLAEVAVDDDGLAALLADLAPADPTAGLTDPDAVPEPPETPYVKAGDVYRLGRHRILCGDSTKAEEVARVLAGERPSLMVTDPPYGVEYDPSWRVAESVKRGFSGAGFSLGTVANDDRADWSEAWLLFPGDVAYVWHSGIHAVEAGQSLQRTTFEIRAQIVWAKQLAAFSRGAYHWQHESCFYAVRRGAAAQWIGDRRQTTLWEIGNAAGYGGKDDGKTEHATQKPVECMARAIRNHAGDVYEPFCGSGTTIIASEQLNRSCYAIEIEPRYVQVAIERWERFTGRKAERVDG